MVSGGREVLRGRSAAEEMEMSNEKKRTRNSDDDDEAMLMVWTILGIENMVFVSIFIS